MNYVGIDPSTKTGLVILNDDGEILNATEVTTKEKGDIQRFSDLALSVVSELEWGDKIVIEGFSYGSKGKGVSTQYGIGWIIRFMMYDCGYDYIEVSPATVKKFATGKGNVKKENMVLPIFKRWGFENESDNIRDAYVMAQIARALDHKGHITKEQKTCLKGVKQ